jgi:hypothetical protein
MATIDLSWTKHLPEGTGAGSRLAAIIEMAVTYQTESDLALASHKKYRGIAVKTARRAERMIAELWTPEEIEAAKKAAEAQPASADIEIPAFLRRVKAAGQGTP